MYGRSGRRVVVNVVEKVQVGEKLPKGWKWSTFGEVCSDSGQYGISDKTSVQPTNIPVLRMGNIFDGKISWNDLKYIEQSEINFEKYKLLEGDILFNRTNSAELVGKTAVFDGSRKAILASYLIRFRVIRNIADPYYIAFYINSYFGKRFVQSNMARAAGQVNISASTMCTMPIPVPPLPEQKRIVAILTDRLSTIDKARTATETQLKAAKALPAAYLREVFDSPEAQKFTSCPIGKVAKVQSGYAFKSNWFTQSGIRLLRNANVLQGFISWDDVVHIPDTEKDKFLTFELFEGDIVLSLDRPIVNNGLKVSRLSSFDVPSLLLQRVGRFQLSEKIDTRYLYAFLNSPKFIDSISGHDQSLGVPHISPKQVAAMKIPLPPLEKQQILAETVWKKIGMSQSLCKSLQSQLTTINKLPAALLRQAFNGEL